MSAEGRQPGDEAATRLYPSVWLIVPTLFLLLGQATAVAPWAIPPQAGSVVLVPLALIIGARWRRLAILVSLAMLTFSVGYVRHRQLLFPDFPENHLRLAMTKEDRLYLEGTLRQEPERLINRSRWQVRAERIWHPTGAEDVTGDLLVGLRNMRRDWRYGDRLRFWVAPILPQDSGNPGGFNYATYLARREIYVTAFLDNDQDVELLARDPGLLRGSIEDLRREIRRFIERNFSRDNSALIKALVVGDMGGISKDIRTAFTAAGVNHVLSISGLHVAMLGLVVFVLIRYGCSFSTFLLLRWNLLKIATFFSFVAVVFYTALAGAMVPTVRSAIMIGVYELAVLLDREEEVFASLTLAALLIGLVWPGVIADISFQLSFLAVLFIVWGMRKVHEWFAATKGDDELPQEKSWITPRLRQAGMHLAVPVLATVGTGPLIAHYFGHLSLVGFIANPLVVPLVGFIVVPVGLIIGFCAVAAPDLASLLTGPAEKLAALTIWMVDAFARFPLANFSVPSPNVLEVAGLYGLILCFFILRKRLHVLTALVVATVWLAADGAYWWNERHRRTELRVTHLNVGQGDAAVVELPGSKVLLIDAGGTASGEFDTGEGIVAPFLRSRKILKVDFLLVSHPRIDHYGGMRTIVNEFSPREFWAGSSKGQTSRFDDLEAALERTKITRVPMTAGEPCRIFDEVKFCVLFPPPDKGDDASVVMRLEYGKLRYLFAGDVDKRGEAWLAQNPKDLRSTIVKIPRHGSATANTAEFIAAVRPRVAVISAGVRARSGVQREEVAGRYRDSGAEVLSTHEDGAITLETDGTSVRYSGYKSGKKGELTL
jgi:competence protein ComEC